MNRTLIKLLVEYLMEQHNVQMFCSEVSENQWKNEKEVNMELVPEPIY